MHRPSFQRPLRQLRRQQFSAMARASRTTWSRPRPHSRQTSQRSRQPSKQIQNPFPAGPLGPQHPRRRARRQRCPWDQVSPQPQPPRGQALLNGLAPCINDHRILLRVRCRHRVHGPVARHAIASGLPSASPRLDQAVRQVTACRHRNAAEPIAMSATFRREAGPSTSGATPPRPPSGAGPARTPATPARAARLPPPGRGACSACPCSLSGETPLAVGRSDTPPPSTMLSCVRTPTASPSSAPGRPPSSMMSAGRGREPVGSRPRPARTSYRREPDTVQLDADHLLTRMPQSGL